MEARTFWPGTNIEKSTNNGFSLGLGHAGAEWAEIFQSAALRAKSAAHVERRRAAGTDTSTFHGMSKAPARRSRMRSAPRVESRATRMRDALKDGPICGLVLAQMMAVPHKMVRKLLQYDLEQGRVVQIRDTRPFSYALAGDADA